MAIEVIVKPKVGVPVWATVIFILCMIGFLVLGGSYFYIDSLSKNIEDKIKAKEKALIETELEKNLKASVFSKQEKINAFTNVITKHRKEFNIFLILESLTHPEVQFLDFNFIPSANQVKLRGSTTSFFILGQQLLILNQEKKIKEINLSGVSMGEAGKIGFSLQLTFEANVFE